MRYDCSIEFGYDWWSHEGDMGMVGHSPGDPETGRWYYWPYTLDEGAPAGSSDAGAGKNPGMWEMPVYTYNQLQGEMVSRITGFDFNMWKSLPSDEEFLEVLKYSFDQRRLGNRSPFTFNAHTDYYSKFNAFDDPEFNTKDYLLRRKAVEEFLEYVLTFDEVRVVTFVDIIKWMRDPKPLAQL